MKTELLFAIPCLPTPAFVAGFVAQATIAIQILGH